MYLLFGGNKKDETKITNDFVTKLTSTIQNQFCQYCNKQLSTKVAFVPGIKHGFTCLACQLQKAVGNKTQNLGDKTLISNQKLAEVMTNALINYQNSLNDSPQQVKEIQNQLKTQIKISATTVQKIKGELKLLKSTTQNKLNDLVKTSETQNSSIIFQELNKKSRQKKANTEEIMQLVCKKSLVNKKGLHFVDDEAIQKMNGELDERVATLKSQIKIKLKDVDELTEWINSIEL